MKRCSVMMIAALLVFGLGASHLAAQKHGGTLVFIHRGAIPTLSLHESGTVSTVVPMMPIYNNLVLFDPLQPMESTDTIIPELATAWRWGDGGKALTFTLRGDVKFHDGKPFTAADVKHTFDMVRGATSGGMKLNPRKIWYENVRDITTSGDHEVTFHLGRPQPALLVMLASGYSPVYPAHVPAAELRTGAIGTGPFRLVSYDRGKGFVHAKNPDYFVKGRPYLDGIRLPIIEKRGTRQAALLAGQGDVGWPYEIKKSVKAQLESQAPQLRFVLGSMNVSENLLMNAKKPPFSDARLRKVVGLAMDRTGLLKSVHQGVGLLGGAMLPKPYGVWGLPPDLLVQVPGMGDIDRERERARDIMRELGYGPDKPLRVTVSTRATSIYVDTAVWLVSELKHVWIEAELKQIESGNWYGMMARRDYQIALNLGGIGADEPDANFFENYTCTSQRNYSDYCNPEVEKKFVAQSSELDPAKRLRLVNEIDLQLQEEGARPILLHRVGWTGHWPHVKNLVIHQTQFSAWRMQDVWLDR